MRFALAVSLLIASAPVMAAEAPPPNCNAPEFRQLDFWMGEWNVKWDGGQGVNSITKSYDGCVVEERFDGGSSMHLKGHSVSTYFRDIHQWRQNWVDNEGGYFDFIGGPQPDGTFIFSNLRISKKTPYARMVFEKIKKDSLTWRWQKSADEGKTWADSWVIYYTHK